MRDIGKNIRDLRVQKGMSQEELAGSLFVTRQTISNYENGKTRPDVEMIMKIAEIFGTDANAVLYGPPVPEEKRTVRRRVIISSAMLLTLAVAAIVLYPISMDIQRRYYIVLLRYLLKVLLIPLLAAVLGWWIVNAAMMLLKIKQLNESQMKKMKWILFILLVFCVILNLPNIIILFQAVFHITEVYFPGMLMLAYVSFLCPCVCLFLGGVLRIIGIPRFSFPQKISSEE